MTQSKKPEWHGTRLRHIMWRVLKVISCIVAKLAARKKITDFYAERNGIWQTVIGRLVSDKEACLSCSVYNTTLGGGSLGFRIDEERS
jgi:hypothetical protein